MRKIGLASLLVAACSALPARGVIVVAGNGAQNSTPPAGLSYWNNIGYVPFGSDTGGSGVYLGNVNGSYWVLTAHHVDGGVTTSFPFIMNRNTAADDATAITYNSVAGSQVVLTYDGKASDIALFKVQPTASNQTFIQALPQIQFGAEVTVGNQITVVGEGRDRKPSATTWDLANPNNPSNTPWTVTTIPNKVDRTGFYYNAPSFSKTWGQNIIETAVGNSPVGIFETPGGQTALFRTRFDQGGLANEAQVSPGDSGGGVFAGNRLVGLPLYVDDFRNAALANSDPFNTDPNPALGQPFVSAVFGNDSYFASLYSYADQIATITGLHPSIDGDANLDGVVDRIDFKIFSDNYLTGNAWTEGDFNLDGRVDFIDYQRLELNYGKTGTLFAAGEPVFASGVPEPGAIGMIGACVIGALARRRR